jgi:serine/threonine protein phosphatase PrpC
MEDRVFLATESSLALSSPEEAVTTTPFDARWLSRSKNGIDSDSDSASSGNSASGSAVVAVFDGHAGSGGADFCARKLPTALEATSLKPPAGRSEQQQQQAPWLKSLASALASAGIGAVATTSNAATATDAASSGADSSSSSVVPPSKTSSAAVAAVAGAWRVLCEQWGNGDGSGAVATIAMVTPDIDNDHDDDAATAGSDSRGVVVAVANCGDSRAVLLEFTEPFGAAQQSKKSAPSSANTRAPPAAPVIVAAQTADHRTDNPDELARLTKAGGKVACDRGKWCT